MPTLNTLEVLPKIEGFTLDELTESQKPHAKVLRHRLLRRSFEAWCRYRMAKVAREPAKHHLLIVQTIERLLRDELPKRNLMLLMPPGAAKSTYTSVLLPAWFLNPEQYPSDMMLACSYSYTLIEGFSKLARDIIQEEENVLGIGIDKNSSAAGDWRTTLRGGNRVAGVGAGIAGNRCRLGLIDDYLGSEEEADSQVIRDKNWNWYWNDFWPRLLPNAWQVIIANRRHEDDLVGRLLNDEANNWIVIRLPMLAEDLDPLGRQPGERLWPEWFTEEQVRLAKKVPRTWAGLWQQRPAPEEGNFFKKEWLVGYSINELPPRESLRMYAGSDFAVRKGEDNDKFCYLSAGLDSQGRLWILPDWYWERCDTDVAVEEMINMAQRNSPLVWWAGRENITGSISPFLTTRMRERNAFFYVEELSESRDKEAKAQPIRARMAAKMVMFPKFLPNWEQAEHQLLTFPAGTNDDFVDALAKLGQGLAKMVPASAPAKQWDGVVPEQRITCGWMARSSERRERRNRRLTYS